MNNNLRDGCEYICSSSLIHRIPWPNQKLRKSALNRQKTKPLHEKILLILVIIASFKNNSFSQIKLLKKAYETESLNDSVLVARREVSIQDWMGFLVYNKFDSLLFPNNSDIPPTTKILFNTFRNYNSKYFHPIDIDAYKNQN